MKNVIGLMTAALILTGCFTHSTEDQKMKINREMHLLNKQVNKRIKAKETLKHKLTGIYIKYDSLQRNASEFEYRINQAAFEKEINAITEQEYKYRIKDMQDEIKIRKLELEYNKL